MQARGLRSADFDPLNQFIKEIGDRLDEFKKINGGDYLTPNQFFKLRRDWNQNYINTFQNASDNVQGKALQILEAFEKDFNGSCKKPKCKFIIRNKS
jgi:hypothetical protein